MFSIKLEDGINVPINISGTNTFANINCIYLKEPAKNELANFYFYFNGQFIKEIQNLGSDQKGSQQEQKEVGEQEYKAMINMCLFNDKFENRKEKIYDLLSKVAFKDEDLKQNLNKDDIEKLSLEDLQEVASSFLSRFWVVRWLKQLTKQTT
jgi:hypothetical protein